MPSVQPRRMTPRWLDQLRGKVLACGYEEQN